MAPTLYIAPTSPPARAVLITAKAIGLDLTLKEVNGFAGEQLKPEYLKLNPQHTIPTFVDDDGFVVWDSHAIMAYIVSKYAKNDSLYPQDLKRRAIIQQRLHFDCGVVFETMKQVARPIFEGQTKISQKDLDSLKEIFDLLELFLDGKKWIAGDSVTIADYSLIAAISSINVFFPVDVQKYPKVARWIKKCEALPEYEANIEGLKKFDEVVKSKMGKT